VITDAPKQSSLFSYQGPNTTINGGETVDGVPFVEILTGSFPGVDATDDQDSKIPPGPTLRTTKVILHPNPGDPRTANSRIRLGAGLSFADGISILDTARKEVEQSVNTDALSASTYQQAIYSLIETRACLLRVELHRTLAELEPIDEQRKAERERAINAETVRCVVGVFRGADGFLPIGEKFRTPHFDTIYKQCAQHNMPRPPLEVVKHLAKAIRTYTISWVDWDVMGMIVKEAFTHVDLVLVERIRNLMIVDAANV
jgi:hypothetical protein